MKTQLAQITDVLLDTMKDVKSKKITSYVGNTISRTASQAIKATVIDRQLSIRERTQDNVAEHIKLQYKKLDK